MNSLPSGQRKLLRHKLSTPKDGVFHLLAGMRALPRLVHLTASTFFGGPERQMLGLASALRPGWDTQIISFPEGGRCEAFLQTARQQGFSTYRLRHDTPRFLAAVDELTASLRSGADALFCHGYKSILLGRIAARRAGIPAVAVSRGWTAENRKVRFYEWLERRALGGMDRVVCVSEGQAEKVRRWCRLAEHKLRVIPNAARIEAFLEDRPEARSRLEACFLPYRPETIVLAAGRLSPEKGFDILLEAAAEVCSQNRGVGVVIFGEGSERPALERRIAQLGLRERVLLPGFSSELDSLLPGADVVALSSYTEGLPNILLEGSAAARPIVATAVGGCPEVVADGETGLLVPPGDPSALAQALRSLVADADLRCRLGQAGRRRMAERFTFTAQAHAYRELLAELLHPKPQPIAA